MKSPIQTISIKLRLYISILYIVDTKNKKIHISRKLWYLRLFTHTCGPAFSAGLFLFVLLDKQVKFHFSFIGSNPNTANLSIYFREAQ